MKHSPILALSLVIAMLSTMAAAQKYTITDLGTLGGRQSVAYAINDAGEVVDVSYLGSNYGLRAFVWTAAGGMRDLGTLGGYNSSALAINNVGQVIGCSDTAPGDSPLRAYIWTQSTGMQDLGSLGGDSCAQDINDQGQVVGWSTVDSNSDSHAFIWTAATGMQDLGVPVSGITAAEAVNEKGFAVGGWLGAAGSQAFIWTPVGGVQDIGNLGQPNSYANSINSFGEVVGFSTVSSSTTAGFWWTYSAGIQALPSPFSTSYTAASKVTDTEEIVGMSFSSSNRPRAVVWPTPAKAYDLNILTVNSPLILTNAIGANRSGLIVGVGTVRSNAALAHAYLATPTQ